jgi:hypothetical protein
MIRYFHHISVIEKKKKFYKAKQLHTKCILKFYHRVMYLVKGITDIKLHYFLTYMNCLYVLPQNTSISVSNFYHQMKGTKMSMPYYSKDTFNQLSEYDASTHQAYFRLCSCTYNDNQQWKFVRSAQYIF